MAPVVLLWGDDLGAIHTALERVRELVLRPNGQDTGMDAFNHERFDGPYTKTIAEVLTACSQLPVMAHRRLVELSAPDDFGKHVQGEDPASAVAAILDYLESPSESTVFVVTTTGVRSNSKLVKAASKSEHAVARRYEVPKDEDAAAELVENAKTRGINIDRRAALALVKAVGGARAEVDAALDRAAAYAGSDRVTTEHVAAVVTDSREANVFALTDAVGQGDHRTALAVLSDLFSTGEKDFGTGQRVFSMLLRQIRMVFAAKSARGDVAGTLGVPPFIARKYEEQARRIGEDRLRAAYRGLARLDAEFKGGEPGSKLAYESPYLVLQRWILDTCGALPGAEPRA
jgi:DNA polymerase-3 subunit delta